MSGNRDNSWRYLYVLITTDAADVLGLIDQFDRVAAAGHRAAIATVRPGVGEWEVEAALEAAVARTLDHGTLLRSDLIPQLHQEMAENLRRDLQFLNLKL